ncbi:unnamed protein product [Enterobius vermicularis]|uniref:Epidermal growth factor receptor substrate 15-like 1 n=1 Tax=Enterobius vermicularis TaxID=51028 RepID=A0A0N4VCI8_ENTVE|nr:unnamed protein product [Enterobius vermicularis]
MMASLVDVSQPHTAIYENLYNEMNPQGKSVIPAQEAAVFLKRSNLSVQILGQVRPVLLNSGLGGTSLAKIWELSDLDKDGQLNRVEMSIALHLVYRALKGDPVPAILPPSLLHRSAVSPIVPPPSKHRNGGRSRTGSVASLDAASTSFVPSSFSSVPLQPRSQSVQPTASSTPTHTLGPMTSLNPLLAWPVQSVRYEREFRKADTNNDDLVSGTDIREELLKSGLSQSTLARLWALVDIKKTGTLNLEQFALIMYLMEQCKKGAPVPSVLAPSLVPPSMRCDEIPNISSLQIMDSVSTGNEELDAIQRDIRNLIDERREADQAVVQLEADMTIKNSEIKNLQAYFFAR